MNFVNIIYLLGKTVITTCVLTVYKSIPERIINIIRMKKILIQNQNR